LLPDGEDASSDFPQPGASLSRSSTIAPFPTTRPAHHSRLASKAFVKRRLRKFTGAHRVCPGAAESFVRGLEELGDGLLSTIAVVYRDELLARSAQGLTGHMPDLQERHVRRAFALLLERLKSQNGILTTWPAHPAAEGVQA
jgi:hypothetical protein